MGKHKQVAKYVLLLFSLAVFVPLTAQKKRPNTGIGLSFEAIGFTYPKDIYVAVFPLPQINYVYLPQPNTVITVAAGAFVGFNDKDEFRPLLPVWFTANYLHLHHYDKKKKARFIYGGKLDVGIGAFAYAGEPYGGGVRYYSKRVLMGLSTQAGVWLKSGKRNFFTATASIGVASLFLKITQAPQSAYTNNIILPIGIRVNYNFLFKRKRG